MERYEDHDIITLPFLASVKRTSRVATVASEVLDS